VTLELWPQGTYTVGADGKITALGSGKTATKPATVRVTVNVKQ
jgi:hypothetical protein